MYQFCNKCTNSVTNGVTTIKWAVFSWSCDLNEMGPTHVNTFFFFHIVDLFLCVSHC